ncbi:hypothetical protein [Solirhodobacter olei]|uniref:hypothetical protein n=1 Tax=Solirhodobacter olei TaxID=2493082 RepID=UPI000FDA1A8D|nr:hypothetical protein [Solirhodobacter olei]
MNASNQTLLDAVRFGEDSTDPTLRQYAKNFLRVTASRGFDRSNLAQEPADLTRYLEIAPKFNKRLTWLGESIVRQGWSASTYKQYQSDGRRLVEHFTGEFAERSERKARRDGFAAAAERGPMLVDAGLVKVEELRSLAAIADAARAEGHDLADLDRERVIALKKHCPTENHWTKVKRGAKLIDKLLPYPCMRDLLPPTEIGSLSGVLREERTIPPQFAAEIDAWVGCVSRIVPPELASEEARELYATELSAGSKGIHQAALRAYVDTLGKLQTITALNTIGGLFDGAAIERVIVAWDRASNSPRGLSARTIYRYIDCIRLALDANGHPTAALKIKTLCTALPILLEGKAANEFMSAETEQWCRDLLASDERQRLFEMQHVYYATKANEALEAAAAAGLDLVALSDPEAMRRLSLEKRSAAKHLLRRARMFGTCAAFAAIEIEAAPFRKSNTLKLCRSGQRQTFFDHRGAPAPYFEIIIPNELLKNSKALTKRNRSLPPFKIAKGRPGDGTYAYGILEFFLKKIRPLFPGARTSGALFAPINPRHDSLCVGTFDEWLRECSTEIELPLTAHNFRHGLCSIEINHDPSCIEQLADLLADHPNTIRRYYAFIDREEQARRLQRDRANRRKASGAINLRLAV